MNREQKPFPTAFKKRNNPTKTSMIAISPNKFTFRILKIQIIQKKHLLPVSNDSHVQFIQSFPTLSLLHYPHSINYNFLINQPIQPKTSLINPIIVLLIVATTLAPRF